MSGKSDMQWWKTPLKVSHFTLPAASSLAAAFSVQFPAWFHLSPFPVGDAGWLLKKSTPPPALVRSMWPQVSQSLKSISLAEGIGSHVVMWPNAIQSKWRSGLRLRILGQRPTLFLGSHLGASEWNQQCRRQSEEMGIWGHWLAAGPSLVWSLYGLSRYLRH